MRVAHRHLSSVYHTTCQPHGGAGGNKRRPRIRLDSRSVRRDSQGLGRGQDPSQTLGHASLRPQCPSGTSDAETKVDAAPLESCTQGDRATSRPRESRGHCGVSRGVRAVLASSKKWRTGEQSGPGRRPPGTEAAPPRANAPTLFSLGQTLGTQPTPAPLEVGFSPAASARTPAGPTPLHTHTPVRKPVCRKLTVRGRVQDEHIHAPRTRVSQKMTIRRGHIELITPTGRTVRG